MEELKVPKSSTLVEVQLSDGRKHSVALFLANQASGHNGRQRVSDLLNGKDEFIPALDIASKVMTFLNRRNISVARVPIEDEKDNAEEYTLPEEKEVRVTLLDG